MIKISLPFSELDPNTIQIPDKNNSNIRVTNVVMVKYSNNGVILVYDLSDYMCHCIYIYIKFDLT